MYERATLQVFGAYCKPVGGLPAGSIVGEYTGQVQQTGRVAGVDFAEWQKVSAPLPLRGPACWQRCRCCCFLLPLQLSPTAECLTAAVGCNQVLDSRMWCNSSYSYQMTVAKEATVSGEKELEFTLDASTHRNELVRPQRRFLPLVATASAATAVTRRT